MGYVIKNPGVGNTELSLKTNTAGMDVQIESSGAGKVILKPGSTGSIEAQGNITMGAGLTVDGVDVSEHNHSGANQGGTLSGSFNISVTGSSASVTNRGAANGVASLDGNTKVPVAQLPTATANGVASLDSNAKVPIAQIPTGDTAGTVAPGNHTIISHDGDYMGHSGNFVRVNTSSPGVHYRAPQDVLSDIQAASSADLSAHTSASAPHSGHLTSSHLVGGSGAHPDASQSLSGFMNSSDKTKLDNLTASQMPKKVYAAPSATMGAPAFRDLDIDHIPDLGTSKITSGVFGMARGGTGKSSWNANRVVITDGNGNLSEEQKLSMAKGGTNNDTFSQNQVVIFDGTKLASLGSDGQTETVTVITGFRIFGGLMHQFGSKTLTFTKGVLTSVSSESWTEMPF